MYLSIPLSKLDLKEKIDAFPLCIVVAALQHLNLK